MAARSNGSRVEELSEGQKGLDLGYEQNEPQEGRPHLPVVVDSIALCV